MQRPVKTPGIKFFLDEVVHVQRLMSADFKLLGMNVYVSGGGSNRCAHVSVNCTKWGTNV